MTPADHALLALAAKAAGKSRAEWDYDWLQANGHELARDVLWNPLENSGQALDLAVLLPGLNLQWIIAEAWQAHDDQPAQLAYVRRAITQAAATIGATMP